MSKLSGPFSDSVSADIHISDSAAELRDFVFSVAAHHGHAVRAGGTIPVVVQSEKEEENEI